MICIKTTKKYCSEDISLIENYEKAIGDAETWHCHHRLETDNDLSLEQLVEKGLYYGRPANELIFIPASEHISMHLKGYTPWNKGLIMSDAFRNKMREINKGEKNPFYGKHHTEEVKQKISEANKGRHPSEETRKKIGDAHRGEKNPSKRQDIRQKLSQIAIERFKDPTKTPVYNKPWYNNGVKEAHYYEGSQPEGWVKGRLKRLKIN